MSPPQAIVIAGPNGSGKTTAAMELLPEGIVYVNADLIASELSGRPGTPGDIRAGRVLLERVEALEANRQSFAIETTLATRMLASRFESWQGAGYETHLIFFWLPDPDLCVQRVAQRVRRGGHHVPEETIRRRYESGMRNLIRYGPLADTWRMYDNSTLEPILVAYGGRDQESQIERPETWSALQTRLTR